jgi:hypothetical protein
MPSRLIAVVIILLIFLSGSSCSNPAATFRGSCEFISMFHSKYLNNTRAVTVYLPPGYNQNLAERYPVLVMQDGQKSFGSVFRKGVLEKWNADLVADRLIHQGIICRCRFKSAEVCRSKSAEPRRSNYAELGLCLTRVWFGRAL